MGWGWSGLLAESPHLAQEGEGGSWIEEVECSLWSLAADSIGEEVGLYPLPRASHWEWLVAYSYWGWLVAFGWY